MYLEAIALSDVGRVRQNNEDNYFLQGKVRQDLSLLRAEEYYTGSDSQSLFAVADGMGGEEDGEIASLVTVQCLQRCALSYVKETAQNSIFQANEMICDEMLGKSGKRMGSTLAALYMDEGMAVGCNVGDSRIYFIRGGKLAQLSVDHTIVQQMVDMGVLTREEARVHKKKNIITQNIGIFPEEMLIEPHFTEPVSLQEGDMFLLCSDGLTDMVRDEEIEEILSKKEITVQADALVKAALKNGGRDNVTVLLVKVKK